MRRIARSYAISSLPEKSVFAVILESFIRIKQMATLHGKGGFTMMSKCMAAEGVF
jgi:hypothetical protein